MVDHTIRAFDTDLQQLAGKIAEMGRLDGEQIADAITALVKRDTARAERVIATDDRVDELQREIEEKAVATIARRQPMAVDLREIVGALRISNDLERVGDLAENIAKRVCLPRSSSSKSYFSSSAWSILCTANWHACCRVRWRILATSLFAVSALAITRPISPRPCIIS